MNITVSVSGIEQANVLTALPENTLQRKQTGLLQKIFSLFSVKPEITVQDIDAPVPNYPDASVSEYRALQCEIYQNSKKILKLRDMNIIDLVLYLLYFAAVFETYMAFMSHSAPNPVSNESSEIILVCAAIIPFTVLVQLKRNAFTKVNNTLKFIQKMRWDRVFYNSIMNARKEGFELGPSLKSLGMFLERQHRKGNSIGKLCLDDIIGMIKLSETINRIADNCAETGVTIEVSGENSELLGRVSEALTGRSLEDITSSQVKITA